MRYPGGKGRSYPQIINLIPPHTTYVETHLGGGAVMRRKLPAEKQVGIDLDPAVIEAWRCSDWQNHCELANCDAVEWLERHQLQSSACIYADPPYLASTRRKKRIYRFEYSDDDHVRLLGALKKQVCSVIISTYHNAIYEEALTAWNRQTFLAASHVGLREETVWYNFPRPAKLHDSRHLGSDYRARSTIRRRQNRLRSRLSRLSVAEQHGIHEWLGSKLLDRQQ